MDPFTIDELTSGFTRSGSGWRSATGGFANHNFWARTRAGQARAKGKWRTVLPSAGTYEILARLPSKNVTSKQARYRVKTADGWVTRKRNQKRNRGNWMRIGIFELTRNPVVKLVDKTGEARSTKRRIAFDAIRFVPASVASTSTVDARDDKPKPTPAREPRDRQPEPQTATREPDSDPLPDPTERDPDPEPVPAPTGSPAPAVKPAADTDVVGHDEA